jgi:uncharacterized membrane protein
MDAYLVIKTLHIVSAAVLFGTGIGIAVFMLFGHFSPDTAGRLFAARVVVRMDFMFTLPAGIVQPLSGAWMIFNGGFSWNDRWLMLTYGLYLLAGLCWLPVVAIQFSMKQMLEVQALGDMFDDAAYLRLFRWWVALGWPAFGGLLFVFWLMVAKPSW